MNASAPLDTGLPLDARVRRRGQERDPFELSAFDSESAGVLSYSNRATGPLESPY